MMSEASIQQSDTISKGFANNLAMKSSVLKAISNYQRNFLM